jgi:hypothetical protein
MGDLIVSREDVEWNGTSPHWIVAADSRGLGLDSCGCERCVDFPPTKIVEHQNLRSIVRVTFFHRKSDDLSACMMAFRASDMKPLTFEEYSANFPATDDLDKD